MYALEICTLHLVRFLTVCYRLRHICSSEFVTNQLCNAKMSRYQDTVLE